MTSLHNFYIPVMGTGFTIDTPFKVAPLGISSVISLVDHILIEKMREYYCKKFSIAYKAINKDHPDARAKSITEYLNLQNDIVNQKFRKLQNAPFEANSEINKYHELLPEGVQKNLFNAMLRETNSITKENMQARLRNSMQIGSIDVNIMTKLDKPNLRDGNVLPYEFNDAAAALRGYAESNLNSTIIFSAGFNPHLYGYTATFPDFFPDENGQLKKKICLKVSDYRSALIQGKYLAKHGLWVSEYRIESAFNCGGHAFSNDGQLLGPILEEFKQNKTKLLALLTPIYQTALKHLQKKDIIDPSFAVTAQGGVGTHAEHSFLLNYYELAGVGWGTPFLLVPEATNVDGYQLKQLINATSNDVALSQSSPLGIPFWNLLVSMSEQKRQEYIEKGMPGSPCLKGFTKLNNEFTNQPICTASREYQKLKLAELDKKTDLTPTQRNRSREEILSKACICHDLAGCVTKLLGIDQNATSAVCPGPNIVNFKKISSLKEMVDHIYGRCSLLSSNSRPHMLIREIELQLAYLINEIRRISLGLPSKSQQKFDIMKKNLTEGINYYKNIAQSLLQEQQDKFLAALDELQGKIENIVLPPQTANT